MDREYLVRHPELIHNLLTQNHALLEIIMIDQSGNVFASAHQLDDPVLNNLFTIPQSNWFIQARQGKTYVSDVQISAANQPYLILAQPAKDGGVLATRLRMSVLWEVVAGLRFGEIGHDNFQDVQIVGSTQAIHFADNGSLPQDNPLGDWLLFTEVAQEEAFSTTRRATIVLAGITGILSILVTLGTSHILQRIILGPIGQLRQGTKRIGRGDLDHRIAIQHQDEIGQVSDAFKEMAALLKQRESALAQARDQAVAANRFKSRLLANVSHDLKTPLSAIIGYADILAEQVYRPINERQRGAIQRILANTERLRNLIGGLLDQAQIDAGKIERQREIFSPAELLSGTEAVLGVLAQKQGLILSAEIEPALPEGLVGDPQRFHQLPMNLVENAIKFTKAGSMRVRLYPEGIYWAMQVADTVVVPLRTPKRASSNHSSR